MLAWLLLLLLPLAGFAADHRVRFSVAPGGDAEFHTVQAAIDHAPLEGAIIRIAPGRYREKITIHKPHIALIGTGASPEDTVLSWDDSAKTVGSTSRSGSILVDADGFQAENLTIENTWENEHQRSKEYASQAVALMMSSDRAVLDHVWLLGAQDTLYANSRTCRDASSEEACAASRQYFSNCFIEGHVDYIFGDAKAVFDHCELHSRAAPNVMITAQSRHSPMEDSGYTFLHCRITGENTVGKVALGRPWRPYATVTFYETDIEQTIMAEGWSDWNDRLMTSTYREYDSHGPGVNGGHRIVDSPVLTRAERKKLNPGHLLAGSDGWDPEKVVKALRKLR
ncbi:pectinesterase family protein [Silvibacterium dinghuense]|nr:pectinesterase family protein [Silvibacterium dinghuense]GGH17328.1 pectinesterase [Silvibacterium dinghuense]